MNSLNVESLINYHSSTKETQTEKACKAVFRDISDDAHTGELLFEDVIRRFHYKITNLRFTFQRSPFVDKDSREVFQLTIHTRLLDIYPAVAGKQDGKEQDVDWNRTITKFFSVKLPLTVNWIARFESIEKPSKTKDILAEYTGKWTSRYFQNQWNLEKKVSIVTELLSEKHKPDLLFDWPKCFHDLLKFTIPQLSKMLERVRINFEEREERRLRGLPPFRPKAEIFGL